MLVRTVQENKTSVLCPQVLQNTKLFLECVSVSPLLHHQPGVTDRSEFASDYVLLLAVLIQFNVQTVFYVPQWNSMVLPHVACPCDGI